ncbi:hypothetical protein DQM68_04085 [Leptospira mayottensis]|uniref:Lipoprotein n=2 Tax=Leptospira mayottensis TaxID=1137606 RepID=A0AA87MNR4_9LEPT|nr:hypothetical protein [Leptospira mayottensis]AZQ03573.1 hypothetical protein LEP1GSC190_17650 [Leptospira mayottensis 200901116]AXR60005.1 hypothetical protein DQM68_04085 [Leptospira mayottensis]AXR63740.1 hypothetical protein DQM28_05375 [Leptospira mayottensis]EKR99620.1 hypothetical protein LEP1GSC125_3323 [Leptospira mayottensis 200901122]TGN17241.1 hypothetical protein EHR03_02270 [Leptospira mayottensis]
MKIQKLTIVFMIIGGILLLTYGCNSQDPVSYNNKIMDILNDSTRDMDTMNTAMVKEDYAVAETVRKSWEEKLVKASENLKSVGDFKGDSNFRLCIGESVAEKNRRSLF